MSVIDKLYSKIQHQHDLLKVGLISQKEHDDAVAELELQLMSI